MPTYISLLRGVNVGGHKKVPMKELKALYEDLGFHQVRTFIQSGNVVFETADGLPAQFISRIEAAIQTQFGFVVTVLVRTVEQWKAVVQNKPFSSEKTELVYVTFLADAPSPENWKKIDPAAFAPDRFEAAGLEIYCLYPNGYGQAKLANPVFESKLKVKATTRNWNTVTKLLDLANQPDPKK